MHTIYFCKTKIYFYVTLLALPKAQERLGGNL